MNLLPQRKILFTDLDGTLLAKDKSIPAGNVKAIEELLAAGHYLVITTGRAVKSAIKIAEQLNLHRPGCFIIAFNGGAIYDCGKKKVCSNVMVEQDKIKYLFDEAKKYGLYIQAYDDENVVLENWCDEAEFYMTHTKMTHRILPDVPAALPDGTNKLIVIHLTDIKRLEEFQRDHRDWEKGNCDSTFSCTEYLEYLPPNVSKGNAILTLCEMLGVDIENSYSAGDERNDISMILAAGHGFAVANAHDSVKEIAPNITKNDNEHNAIAEIIYDYML